MLDHLYLKRSFPLQENTYVGDYYEWSESIIVFVSLERTLTFLLR